MSKTLDELNQELEALDNQWLELIEQFPDDKRQELLAQRQEYKAQKAKRDEEFKALVKKCHPDNDNHWPPHPDCPVCEKVFEKLENMARAELVGPSGEPKCPKCGNSMQNAVPADSPDCLRCASCKHVWDKMKALEEKVLEIFERLYLTPKPEIVTKGPENAKQG